MRPPLRHYHGWKFDSRRWAAYRPRAGDIVIPTYPKCGTTWMQRIVNMLVAGSAAPAHLFSQGGWPDMREGGLEPMATDLEAVPGRRVLKSHIPADGLPIYDELFYVHVARDGRDACMSYHNHCLAYTQMVLDLHDANGLGDPTIAAPYPRAPADPRAFFADWLRGGTPESFDELGFFAFQASWWAERGRANVLMVHYNDLKADLAGEIGRIAGFLGIVHPAGLMAEIIEAASFEAMQRDGEALAPFAGEVWEGGMERFLHKATNHRWRDVLTADDLAAYDSAASALPPACRRWLEAGMRGAGDPRFAV